MRLVLAVAAAALALTAAVAAAQTQAQMPPSRCPEFPTAPTLPDGASARRFNAMERGNEAHTNWSQQMQQVLLCRQTEARELQAKYEPMRTHVEARIKEFNDGRLRQKQVCRTWVTELNEFYQRNDQADRVQDPTICEGGATQPATPR